MVALKGFQVALPTNGDRAARNQRPIEGITGISKYLSDVPGCQYEESHDYDFRDPGDIGATEGPRVAPEQRLAWVSQAPELEQFSEENWSQVCELFHHNPDVISPDAEGYPFRFPWLKPKKSLHPYQAYCVWWMLQHENRETDGGMLADEMGLGKVYLGFSLTCSVIAPPFEDRTWLTMPSPSRLLPLSLFPKPCGMHLLLGVIPEWTKANIIVDLSRSPSWPARPRIGRSSAFHVHVPARKYVASCRVRKTYWQGDRPSSLPQRQP